MTDKKFVFVSDGNGGFRKFCSEDQKADPGRNYDGKKPSAPEDEEPLEEVKAYDALPIQNRCGAPKSGSFCFENTTTTEALNLVSSVLGSVSIARLTVSWEE